MGTVCMAGRDVANTASTRGVSLSKSGVFRALMGADEPIVAPCAYDCLSLRIIEKAGFPAALHGGYNSAASLLGLPDVGLMTMTEALYAARNMARSVEIPVLADIDDGFGYLNNVDRTAREVIGGGLAGLFIEDQQSPRRSPSLGGGTVISTEAMCRKLAVIDAARHELDPDFVIVARTHASRAEDLRRAVERGRAYAAAGADVLFFDPAYDDSAIQEFEQVASELGGRIQLMANMSETVGRPLLTTSELYAMGYKIIIYPVTAIMAAAGGVWAAMSALSEQGTTRGVLDRLMPLKEVATLTGIDHANAFDERWGAGEEST